MAEATAPVDSPVDAPTPTPPQSDSLDGAITLLRLGNRFISDQCDRYQSDIFVTRLLLSPTVCMRGAAAAEAFYKPGRMTRSGAIPPNVLTLLQDRGSVATLDDGAHHHRKQMFMSLMTPGSLQVMNDLLRQELLRTAEERWQQQERVQAHWELQRVYCAAVCKWLGIELPPADLDARTGELAAMIDGAGDFGWRNIRGQWLRQRTERWAQELVRERRARSEAGGEKVLMDAVALHRDEAGELLPVEVAAVELINLVRPTVAVANFAVLALTALATFPHVEAELRSGALDLDPFIQEVRRYYPFFPFLGGISREEFEFAGYRFPAGQRFLLDAYGTNRHAASWAKPDTFDPHRFATTEITPFNLIPQGGGDFAVNHRCPGEWLTLGCLRVTLDVLLNQLEYKVPPQDLTIDMRRMPALPASRMLLEAVQRRS